MAILQTARHRHNQRSYVKVVSYNAIATGISVAAKTPIKKYFSSSIHRDILISLKRRDFLVNRIYL